MAVSFDFKNNRIEVTGDTVVGQDLINAIRTAEASWEGMAYSAIALGSGKQLLSEDVYVGITIELTNGWQVHFQPGSYIAKIVGANLVGGPDGNPVAYSADVQVKLIQCADSTLTEPESQWTDLELRQLRHRLGIDGISSVPAVTPNLTSEPVEGALSIAQALRLILAVLTGRTTIDTGPPVVVSFKAPLDTSDRVVAEMDGSERIHITLNP